MPVYSYHENDRTQSIDKSSRVSPILTLFFTKDVTEKGQRIADLQRRACWIALALLLQCLNEIAFAAIQTTKETIYQSLPWPLKAVDILVPVLLIIGSFWALWMALRSTRKKAELREPALWQRLILLVSLGLACGGLVVCGISIARCFFPPQFSNDGTILDTNAALALLRGQNPYGDPSLKNLTLFNVEIHEDWTTPLRRGEFQGQRDYPTREELQKVLHKYTNNTTKQPVQAVEFETKVSYPAFSFLTLVPFVFIKDYNVLPLYLLCHLLLIGCAWKFARPELRPWVLLLAFANISTWTATAGETLDMLYTLFIALAWLLGGRRWWSILFLGLGIASKQIAWFFVPFYFVMIWRQYSLKEATMRLVIAGMVGLLINLPFMLWNFAAWYAGVMAPESDPMFPLGTGIINLSTGHLIPYFPEWSYKFLMIAAYAVVLIYYWLRCRKWPEMAMLLAVVPLFFAWRSLPSYFYCSAFPLLALMMARHNHGEEKDVPERLVPALAAEV